MMYTTKHVRPGLTAIAAVLALSSTPLLAQETTVPPDPAVQAPADPAPVADPLAPEPSAPEPAATESAPAETAAPAATARRAPARARATTTARAPVPARARTAAPAQPAPVAEAPVAPVPIALPPAELAAEPAPLPVAQAEPVESNWLADESLPFAAGAGLGLIALGGIGMAVGRRRRRRIELDHIRANEAYLDQHPVEPVPVAAVPSEPVRNDREPAFVRSSLAPVAAPSSLPEAEVLEDAPKTQLPKGFDLSRFGPHVRAAYMGPTPDNPSLSLKYRLRRAAAMDQRARLEAEQNPQPEQSVVQPQPAQKPVWAINDEGFMFRKVGSGQPSKASASITRH